MTTETKRPGAHTFIAFELALQIIRCLRDIVTVIRRHDAKLAQQIVDAASSIPSNVAEGNRRIGKDRLHFFRVAAGTRCAKSSALRDFRSDCCRRSTNVT